MVAAAASSVELDFFGMEKKAAFAKPPMKVLDRKRSFRDIQGMISKINPKVVKAVIASRSADAVSVENSNVLSPKAGKKHQTFSSPLPLCNPMYSFAHQTGVGTAPMTIFYNGAVFVYNVPYEKAENILQVAGKVAESIPGIKPNNIFLQTNEGLRLTHKKSLKRFLNKRKQRQINT